MISREEAEAIEQFGDDLESLCRAFFVKWGRMSKDTAIRLTALDNKAYLSDHYPAFRALGREMSAECDAAEEAADFGRANPLEPDFRRIG